MTQTRSEVAKKETTLPVIATQYQKGSWGQAPRMSARDIVIPRMLLMQPGSDKVLAKEAQFGELRDSVSNELLLKEGETLDIIPFHMKKAIIVSEYPNEKAKKAIYKETIEATPENEALPYRDGLITRQAIMRFFVLLPKEVEAGGAIPKTITFKSSSREAGNVIATQMYQINAAANPWLPPPNFLMTLKIKVDTNDKGTYAVFQASKGRKATDEELALAFHWFNSMNGGAANIKVEEVEEVEEENVNTETGEITPAVEAAQNALGAKVVKTPQPLRDPGNY